MTDLADDAPFDPVYCKKVVRNQNRALNNLIIRYFKRRMT